MSDGTKLPLQFIAKGETQAVLDSQIGDVVYHNRTFSSNGWTTSETLKQYLSVFVNNIVFKIETQYMAINFQLFWSCSRATIIYIDKEQKAELKHYRIEIDINI